MGSIRVGRPHTKPDATGHVPGMHQGNKGPYAHQRGHHKDGTADARRSTGVQWKRHDALLDVMPNIPPA
ncbi:hypothetical protein QNN03_28920 [Streptomyces sp. GXMU-J15]|uniref:Transposase n=1 Tax=Streptomyces fuscus TaxID=3048495 RepID=A0ABT7J6H9_9ACTN|nr:MULTISPECIES: hypothetical protein [Streptomyces]MDL2080475.1 hypothetical protein [Streptomyces fuscus]SBT92341.1 hypothetical protein GA0115233_104353 [Streptomyces sp. DI166]